MSQSAAECPGFEGPEKTIEIDFKPNKGPNKGLRELSRAQLDEICTAAKCTILCSMHGDDLDSYVLSESSMFIYAHKFVMKTCGTTTILKAVPVLTRMAKELEMEVEWFSYTRKDFIYPEYQLYPHSSTSDEVAYLQKLYPSGGAYILGPITADHWFVFVADFCERPTSESTDRTLNIMMYDMDPEVAAMFSKTNVKDSDADVTTLAGIDTLLPGSRIQEFVFEPWGYSMNGDANGSYFTIHITPESHCSYASFETNIRLDDYDVLVARVLGIFKPKRFTMTLFADEQGIQEMSGPLPLHTTLPRRSPSSPTPMSQGWGSGLRPIAMARKVGKGEGDDDDVQDKEIEGEEEEEESTRASTASADSGGDGRSGDGEGAEEEEDVDVEGDDEEGKNDEEEGGGEGARYTYRAASPDYADDVARVRRHSIAASGDVGLLEYARTAQSHTAFEGDYCCYLGNYVCVSS
jgi:S-adenosylmethionine decarboxylase